MKDASKPKGFLLANTFRFLNRVIPARLKRKGVVTIFLVFLNSLVDLLGLATLIPLFVVILDEKKIAESRILQQVYQGLNFSSNRNFIIFLCISVLLLIVVKNIISVLLNLAQYRYSFSLYRYFSSRLFQFYHTQGLLFLKNNNSNRLINHINSVALLFAQQVIVSFLGVLNELIIIALVVIGIFIYEPRIIGILAVTILPVFFLFFRLIKSKLHNLGSSINKTAIQLQKTLHETFQGYVDIEIRNKAGWNFSKFTRFMNKMSQLQIRNQLFLQMPLKVIEVGVIMGLMAIIMLSLLLHENLSGLSLLLGIFGIAAYRILPSINRVMVFLMNIRNHQYTYEIIERTINVPEQNEMAESTSKRLAFTDALHIENLSFSFNEGSSTVIDGISLQIKKGERVGLIGRSGSGKTTLLNILLRFYFQQSGKILVDRVELNRSNVAMWRNIIGYVPQEVFMMDGSLAENVAFGEDIDDIDMDKVKRVVKLANLDDLINSLPAGLMTNIGERGSKLSGGQKQRIGIARALYRDAEILFFDEATSSLDSITEEEITNSIKYLSETDKTLTILIIAHRITTLKHCDRIIELQDGKIAGEYTYQEITERV